MMPKGKEHFSLDLFSQLTQLLQSFSHVFPETWEVNRAMLFLSVVQKRKWRPREINVLAQAKSGQESQSHFLGLFFL